MYFLLKYLLKSLLHVITDGKLFLELYKWNDTNGDWTKCKAFKDTMHCGNGIQYFFSNQCLFNMSERVEEVKCGIRTRIKSRSCYVVCPGI